MVDGRIRHATGLKPLALAQGVGSLLSETMPEPGILILLRLGLSAVGIGSRYFKKLGKE